MKLTPAGSNIRTILFALCLVAISVVAYWPGLSGNFIFDDLPNLIQADHWKVTTLAWAEWTAVLSDGRSSEIGRPLAMLTFAVNHYFTGMDPWPMKATNLVFHCINSILVWVLCARLFSLAGVRGPAPGPHAALLVAAAWAIHPIQISTVLYIVQRMEILSHVFVLIALLAYLQARGRQIAGRPSLAWFGASAASVAIALGFKETAILVPAYTFLTELFLLRFQGRSGSSLVWLKRAYLLLFIAGISVYALWVVPHYAGSPAWQFRDYDLWDRLLTQPPILLMYLGQILVPNPEKLLFFYDHLAHSQRIFSPIWIAGSSLLIIVLIAMSLGLNRRQPLIGFGILFFLFSHALTSNVVPLELAFEHRNYSGLMGVLISIFALLTVIGRSWEKKTKLLLAGTGLSFLFALTLLQALTWGDRLNLAMTLAARNPDSARASYGIAVELQIASGGDPQHPLWSLALKQMQDTSAIDHGAPLGEQGEIIMLAQVGRMAPAGTWDRLRAKLGKRTLSADDTSVMHALLNCSLKPGCAIDEDQLKQTFLDTTTANPASAELRVLFATFALRRMQDSDLATTLLTEALSMEPDNAAIRVALLRARLAAGWRDGGEIEAELREIRKHDKEGQFDSVILELTDSLRPSE